MELITCRKDDRKMRTNYWLETSSEKTIGKRVSRLEANVKMDVKEVGVTVRAG
jgi:hypothetical protein